MERVWRALKEDLAWPQCLDLEAQQRSGGTWWQADDAPTLQALTAYADVVEARHALGS
jgi:hypothetical protein